jgi:hypothetical protein
MPDARSRQRKRWLYAAALGAAVLLLAACTAGPNNVAQIDAPRIAGFWLGLWHGLICPITFLISLFTDDVSVYEVQNNGNWYDFGFVLGVAIAFSGPARIGGRTASLRRRTS